jgi:membrane protease YdiL (CAAX protease family)
MIRFEHSVWLTILIVEVPFFILTRVILSRYWTYSLDAELIRTPLRLVAVFVYWRLLHDFIQSQPIRYRSLLQPALFLAVVLFMSVPLLVGDLSYMTPTTRVVYALTSIAVGLKEEIAFRALIQNLVAKRLGNLVGILIATVLFTVYHFGAIPLVLFAYGQVAIISLFLGIVYVSTRNLWLVAGLHTLYDALWSATPVLSPPLPYSVGLTVLSAALFCVAWWGWSSIWPNRVRGNC